MKRKQFQFIIAVLCAAVFIFAGCKSSYEKESGWHLLPEILSEINPPTFPDKKYVITEYGAVGDGQSDCTEAIKSAIAACHDNGGGSVVIPRGIWLTGAIHLKSNVNLHVQKDGVLLFSRDLKQYLPLVHTRFEGVECMNYSPFIYAYGQENVAITGAGVLDGQADDTLWWPWAGKRKYGWSEDIPDQKRDRDALFEMAEKNVPVEERIYGNGHFIRVNFIQFYKCKNVLVDSITIKRSPMWEIHPVLCENVIVQNVVVISHGPNNDGCNPESCRNVLIKNCYFDTGDDCIAIKSGRNEDGRRVNVPSENIVIQGCRMKDGHGGVVIGSEISGDVRNVYAEDCVMNSPNLERALRIKTNSRRGGVVENIFMRNVEVGEVSDAVVRINFNYGEGDVGKHAPVVRNIVVQNVTSQKSAYALRFEGYKRSPIRNVRIKDCSFQGVAKGNRIKHVVGLEMNNVTINDKLQHSKK
ncbi:MAG: glycoside hydrolase family 28 protein [candidate division KSB1 bacterium]|jgi:polygalacturonase|nr:glycoside hydrolase family 28 protein [candidate division KSB1 bacterium]